ncbi:membrane protein [Porphyromonas crevioricanis]|uniref:DNA uptake lipoprotein n=1 Tax=Porphyromonas crevioricanis TaxID=393921 RepID=A0A0A2FJ33_9PORP|nr:outer membrane protein assembly factor BamD [Porphyromonas crevioricanis]KGN90065.1 membrane protein [Porphyromonas crevioricanis]KGN94246.1 membrane protein [Porphyromonas crevioricanis]GAD07337.1 outer membrane assembly lipoprotein YfiO [Porphyromonas crevioricanis JCM 13913]SQH72271.1 DNA uptake lipoprotein [Porphyromonas crevioricanis]
MHKAVFRLFLVFASLIMGLSSCSEFVRVQKSANNNLKYAYAKKYYESGKYSKAIDLLQEVVPVFNGSAEGPESLYLLADSYYKDNRPIAASDFFVRYYSSYPKAPKAEEARYKAAMGFYEASPEARLDQSATYEAIQEMQAYLDFYPEGVHVEKIKQMLFDLQDKLAYKEYLHAELYYNLGLYMGNNYRACIITGKEALKEFPYTKYREDFLYLILRASYKEASFSVNEKVQTRYREVLDQYYAYINEFPDGKYLRQVRQIYEFVSKHISKNV